MESVPVHVWVSHALDWAWAVVLGVLGVLTGVYRGVNNKVIKNEEAIKAFPNKYVSKEEMLAHRNEMTAMVVSHKNDMHTMMSGFNARIDRMDEKMDSRFDRITDLIVDSRKKRA